MINALIGAQPGQNLPPLSLPSLQLISLPNLKASLRPGSRFVLRTNGTSSVSFSLWCSTFRRPLIASRSPAFAWTRVEGESTYDDVLAAELEDLAPEGVVYLSTLRLVECSMFAAVAGLTYLLSSSLALENYFGCFFPFPIVISSMRWGVASGRKTMVATFVLLLVLSGPVKALTYLFMHGLVGLALGSLWRLKVSWSSSVVLCAMARAIGAMGYVLTSSFLIRENILALITVNIHATLTYILNAVGINAVLSMNMVYTLFGSLLLLNCGFFVFLLHILYAVFLTRLGMKSSLLLPKWVEKALLG